MADFALLESQKLISRIRMTENSWNFHTVTGCLLPQKTRSWCVHRPPIFQCYLKLSKQFWEFCYDMPIQKAKRIFPLGHTWDLVLARLNLGLRLILERLENLMFHYSMDIARLKKEKSWNQWNWFFCKSSPLLAQILREINFEECGSSKTAVFVIFGALNFVALVNFSLQKVQTFMKIKIQSL